MRPFSLGCVDTTNIAWDAEKNCPSCPLLQIVANVQTQLDEKYSPKLGRKEANIIWEGLMVSLGDKYVLSKN